MMPLVDLSEAYELAWAEWRRSGAFDAWETTVADGLAAD